MHQGASFVIASDSHREAVAAATEVAAKLKSITHLFLLLSIPFPEYGIRPFTLIFTLIFTLDPAACVGAAATLARVHLSMALTADCPMAASHSSSEKGIVITTQNTTSRMHHDFPGLHIAIWEFWLSQLWQPFPADMPVPGIPDVLPSEDVDARMLCLTAPPGNQLQVPSSISVEVAAHFCRYSNQGNHGNHY